MGPSQYSIENAIGQATRARAYLRKGKSRQVRSIDEIDQLRSVANAWFHTHRAVIASNAGHLNLTPVDVAYKTVLEAANRHAARGTYDDALGSVRSSLATLLTECVLPPKSASTLEAAPSFAPLASDQRMQSILENRWSECQRCIGSQAYLAATVMMGGMLETLLVSRANRMNTQAPLFTATATPKDRQGKSLPLAEWKLTNFIAVANELGWITKSALQVGHVLREYRNYVHPHKEYSDNLSITVEDVQLFWEVTKALTRQVLTSTSRAP